MGKMLMVAGIILLVLGGLVTVGLGLIAPMLIDQAIEDGLNDALVVKEEDYDEPWVFPTGVNPGPWSMGVPTITGDATTEGDEWLYDGPENEDAAPTWDSFYMYNITNYNPLTNTFADIPGTAADETGTPVYVEVGPLVCRKVEYTIVVEETDDTITYNTQNWYLLDVTQSAILPTANIINWNPAYWAYVDGAGGENMLFANFADVPIKVINDSIYGLAAQLTGSVPPGTELVYSMAQWGNFSVSQTLYGNNSAMTNYELALFAQNVLPPGVPYNLSQPQVENLLYNTSIGLVANKASMQSFIATYDTMSSTYEALYGMTATQISILGAYLKTYIHGFMWQGDGTQFFGGISYVAQRSLAEWLFWYYDPVQAAALGAAYTPSGLFDNDTTTGTNLKRFNTGAKDLDKIWDEETEEGLEEFAPGTTGYWLTTEEVAGTDATHFAPDVGKDDTLLVWNSDTMRQLDFEYLEEGEVKGIDTLRFHLSFEEFLPNANYWQNIEGYANMTLWAGAPIYLSTPHYQDYEEAPPEQYDIIVDVEPNTGAVLKGYKRLQFNVALYNFTYFQTAVSGANWFEGQSNAKYYLEPLGWIQRFATAEDLPASEFKDAKDSIDDLISAKELSGLVSIGGLGAGLVLFAAGAAMVIIPKFAGGGAAE
ncbi:MAG: hypothetical protein ACFFGZ_04265 [Candidatus Thorarchaeota archaeon]